MYLCCAYDSGGRWDDDTAVECDGSAFLCGGGFGIDDGGFAVCGDHCGGVACSFYSGERRRAVKGLLVALIALCGMATLSGCGACTDLGTKPGSYTIRVIGTSGSSVVTTKVQVTVTAE